MIRYDLDTVSEDEMREHIRSGVKNATLFRDMQDGQTAFDEEFQEVVDEADVVYGVWPESDPAEQSVCGHALSVIKGIPWLNARYDVHRGADFQARTFTLTLDDFEDACAICRTYGDDKEVAVAPPAPAPPGPVADQPTLGMSRRTLLSLSRPLREEDLRYHPLSLYERHPIDEEKEALLVAARKEVATPEGIERRRAELQRLKTALARMMNQPDGKPRHKRGYRSIQTRTSLRPVGNFVFAALSAEERTYLAEQMILADGDREELSGWHDSLGNHGMSAGSGRTGTPSDDEMRDILEDLGVFRTDSLCTAGEWSSVTEGLPCSRERLAELYGAASGISDEILWGVKETAADHKEARAVIQALDDRRDALILEGWEVPRAHVASERWYPAVAAKPVADAQASLLD